MRLSLAAALLVTAFAVQDAGADVRYEYTGGTLTSYLPDLFQSTDRVAAFFTLARAPASGTFTANDFGDYGFSIGGLSLTRADGADSGAYFKFAPDGSITSWSFVVGDYSTPSGAPSLVELWSNSADLPPASDRVVVSHHGATVLGAYAGASGAWSVSVVPEPASAFLLLCGLGLFAVGWQRKAAQEAKP